MAAEEQQELDWGALLVCEQLSNVSDFSLYFSGGAQVQLVVNIEALFVRERPEPRCLVL